LGGGAKCTCSGFFRAFGDSDLFDGLPEINPLENLLGETPRNTN